MKNSKITKPFTGLLSVILLSLFMVAAGTLVAQKPDQKGGGGNASPEDRAKRLTLMMKDNLSLTAAQEPKVADINLKYAKKNEEIRNIADTTARRKAFQSANKQKDAELKVILTAEQFKTYLKLAEELKARRRGM